ncbi:peptidoglycan DD-metalloendopeptidase family protein [Vibrio sp. PNB22_3_1]
MLTAYIISLTQRMKRTYALALLCLAVPINATIYSNNDNSIEIQRPIEISHTVEADESLSSIFHQLSLYQSDLIMILRADRDRLALDTIRPGDKLNITLDERKIRVKQLSFEASPGVIDTYTRQINGRYLHNVENSDGQWQYSLHSGKIYTSFSGAAQEAGLKRKEWTQIVTLLTHRIDFSRDIRPGTEFKVLKRWQKDSVKSSGASEIVGIQFDLHNRSQHAYLHNNGRYYDENGHGLEPSFLQEPVKDKVRISSHFSQNRLHPVTKKRKPHLGTDFATNVGTPIIATSNGTVVKVRRHPYAGKYITIAHGTKYKTRYLHLSAFKVKQGDKVKRGDVIGLSGKSGRVTGPHLHYELLINGRAVDPMKAKVPMRKSLDKHELIEFNRTKALLLAELKSRSHDA